MGNIALTRQGLHARPSRLLDAVPDGIVEQQLSRLAADRHVLRVTFGESLLFDHSRTHANIHHLQERLAAFVDRRRLLLRGRRRRLRRGHARRVDAIALEDALGEYRQRHCSAEVLLIRPPHGDEHYHDTATAAANGGV